MASSWSRPKKLWESTHVVIPAKNVAGENRNALLGKIDKKLYVAIFTIRGDTLRLISCHRADARWERVYERYIQEKGG